VRLNWCTSSAEQVKKSNQLAASKSKGTHRSNKDKREIANRGLNGKEETKIKGRQIATVSRRFGMKSRVEGTAGVRDKTREKMKEAAVVRIGVISESGADTGRLGLLSPNRCR